MTVTTLPEDVLGEIVETSSRDAQATLCQVSRLFNSLGIRYLYRSVILTSPRQVVSCCKTLTANPVIAEAVQTFSFRFPWVYNEPRQAALDFLNPLGETRSDPIGSFCLFIRLYTQLLHRFLTWSPSNSIVWMLNCITSSPMWPSIGL